MHTDEKKKKLFLFNENRARIPAAMHYDYTDSNNKSEPRAG